MRINIISFLLQAIFIGAGFIAKSKKGTNTLKENQ